MKPLPTEVSLDPENWDELSRVAHQALDDALATLRDVRDGPPWRPLTPAARAELGEGVPRRPTALGAVYEQFRRAILPFRTGNVHPRFWGWVMGTGTAEGVVADLLASAMNCHVGGYDQSASEVERRVVAWLAELMGYPAAASGLLVSGATVANLTGLAVARSVAAGFDVRKDGLAGHPRLRVYGSRETHSWAEKCCDLLGLGREGFKRVAVDSEGRIEIAALRAALREDRTAGVRPMCVVGNAGTVDGGAIDDLDALADLCAEERLWFHIDGAFGALANLSPRLRPALRGLARSDSLAFDLHKWGYLQYEVGCVLVRDRAAHRSTFQTAAEYLRPLARGIQPGPLEFADLGIELSRGFRALRVWMSLKTHGVERLAQVIEQNVEQARSLADRVRAEPELELLGPVPLNVICFRYRGRGMADAVLDDLNREIVVRLQEDGIAIVSSTRRGGHLALRLAITNHRSRQEDFDVLVDAVLRLGREPAVATKAGDPRSGSL